MESVQSERGTLWLKDGFIFKSSFVKNGVRYLKCMYSGCGCRVSFHEVRGEVKVGLHNHQVDEVEVETLRFKAELKTLAMSDNRSQRVIFDEVCTR